MKSTIGSTFSVFSIRMSVVDGETEAIMRDGVGLEADFLRGEVRLSISGVVLSFVWLKKD